MKVKTKDLLDALLAQAEDKEKFKKAVNGWCRDKSSKLAENKMRPPVYPEGFRSGIALLDDPGYRESKTIDKVLADRAARCDSCNKAPILCHCAVNQYAKGE